MPIQSLKDLESGPFHWFRDWPNPQVPSVCVGVYTVWLYEMLIYVGMSGRSLTQEMILKLRASNGGNHGLFKRVRSHSRGRRSGDQFCVYVADRFVLPTLSSNDIKQISEGHWKLDAMIREYIHANFAYRFVEISCGPEALALEDQIRRGALLGRETTPESEEQVTTRVGLFPRSTA